MNKYLFLQKAAIVSLLYTGKIGRGMQQLFYTGKIGRGMQHDFVLVLQETKKFQLSDEGYVLSYYKNRRNVYNTEY